MPKCTLSKTIVIEEETVSAYLAGFFAAVFLDTSFKQLSKLNWRTVRKLEYAPLLPVYLN